MYFSHIFSEKNELTVAARESYNPRPGLVPANHISEKQDTLLTSSSALTKQLLSDNSPLQEAHCTTEAVCMPIADKIAQSAFPILVRPWAGIPRIYLCTPILSHTFIFFDHPSPPAYPTKSETTWAHRQQYVSSI